MMEKIFKDYASYYDLINSDKDYASEIEFREKILKMFATRVKSILELGCGTGSHLIRLANRGYKVLGVDISAEMVQVGRAKLHKAGVAKENADILIGDIRNIDLKREFDVVQCSFHVMSYMTTHQDLVDLFSSAQRHLKIGGCFIFDFWFSSAVKHIGASSRSKTIMNDEISVTRVAVPTRSIYPNCIDVNYTFKIVKFKESSTTLFKETHTMRHFEVSEISSLCGNTFESVATFGDNTFEPPTKDTWTVVAVLRKTR